ncbi:hypothetical protein SLS57_009505 [Botryosphaeria dothidea]
MDSEGGSKRALTVTVVLVCVIAYAAVKTYHARRSFDRLRKQGLPVAEWSWIFGGLLTLRKHMSMFPPGADSKYAFTEMAWKANKGGVYVDLWPFTLPVLVISSPVLAAQMKDQNTNAKRSPGVNEGIERITGGPSLLTLPDIHWKQWRTVFNPGFNPSYVLEQTSKIILNPMQTLRLAHNDRILRREIGAELEKCFLERKADMKTSSQRVKSIIALAMDAYMTENKLQEESLDPVFKHQASTQLRLFMFAGHDTTSSTIIYVYHMLSQNPDCLGRVRTELDAVLGPDISSASARLSNEPVLINQLHYTTACIKETLLLYVVHLAIHRNRHYFPDPNTFNPERWLVSADHPLRPPKEAFRPFEHGARNCIGQTLAMLELKIVLALTVREMDVVPAYEEWEKLHPSGGKIKTAFGDRAYGVSDTAGGSHAAHKYPCRVKVRV